MPPHADTAQRDPLLEKALDQFALYGYRKTSLDAVAEAAGVSRQTLYKRYGSKENLFREAMADHFEATARAARLALDDASAPLAERLLAAFDASAGQFIDTMKASPHFVEILDATHTLVGDLCAASHLRFMQMLANAVAGCPAVRAGGHAPMDVARTLYHAHKGIFFLCDGHAGYLEDLRLAIAIICPGTAP
ncbi:TetR/AcrR family transcriptional regulator [Desulfocurvus sp. DL9XJH121]